MKTNLQISPVILWGLALNVLSAFVFFLPVITAMDSDAYFALFFINYLLAIGYLIGSAANGSYKKGREGLRPGLMVCILFLISAYALNRTIPVFEETVPWLGWLLTTVGAATCMAVFFEHFPRWLQQVIAIVLGIALVLYLYLAVYIAPVYPIAAIAFLALGLSLHAFVPIVLLIVTVTWLQRTQKRFRYIRAGLFTGMLFAIAVIILHSCYWASLNEKANRAGQYALLEGRHDLPSWMRVAQQLPDNFIAEQYLKASLVYSTPDFSQTAFSFGIPDRRLDEKRKHDPLVMMSSLMTKSSSLTEDGRVKILECMYDARHKTQERLWRGDHLATTNLITNVQVWPEYRMSYTEKTITVCNNNPERWRDEEEAIYTFYMPEGSVVTSLSLWINGVEEKGMLTTKGNADTAYKSIVGVPVPRDPSVVHWQEGNTVSVRVFPVSKDLPRNFKIGITAPLQEDENGLRYENIYFDGPDAGDAREIVQIETPVAPLNETLKQFEPAGASRFRKERNYRREWQLLYKKTPVKEGSFVFNGFRYATQQYLPERVASSIQTIYLDVNKYWSKDDFEGAWLAADGRPVYVFDHENLVRATSKNKDELFDLLHKDQFSLFPFYELKHAANSLVVTKGMKEGPNTNDLKNTPFSRLLSAWSEQQSSPLKVYDLGSELSPLLKTLKEHRFFAYEKGNVGLLKKLVRQQVFARSQEDDGHVVLEQAGLKLAKIADTVSGGDSAPDHLLRLYAYNDILRQLKGSLFAAAQAENMLIKEAEEAYVVSPVSSLIVLETQADYQRFNIETSKNSLQNASIKAKGAVPEPHEWALIIAACLVLTWIRFKKYFNASWNPFS